MTNNISEEIDYASLTDEEIIEAMYGGAENMKNLVLLTNQQVIDIQRSKILSYLDRPDTPEHMKHLYLESLKELDAYERKLNQKGDSND